MAILGVGGSLELIREAPSPVVLSPYAIDDVSNSIVATDNAYWTGDQVRLTSANGLPVDTSNNGPDSPDGYAMYFGSRWFLGYNKQHVTSSEQPYFLPAPNDSSDFYARPDVTGLTTALSFFIFRDQLDRLSFYPTRDLALAGESANRINLYDVDISSLILSPAGNVSYNTILDAAAAQLRDYVQSTDEETELGRLVELTPDPADALSAGEWVVQAQLREWSLNLSATEVDTTALGERFGDSVKSIITGGGQLDFLIDRRIEASNAQEPAVLLNLLMITNQGGKARARFYLFKDREGSGIILPGSLYYETEILVTSEAINLRPDEIVAGTLSFVAVKQVKLLMAPG